MGYIMAVNAGSSSLKWKLFAMPDEAVVASGNVERVGLKDSIFGMKYQGEKTERVLDIHDHNEALNEILNTLKSEEIIESLNDITAVGHRVVAGGEIFKESTVIDEKALEEIEALSELAPLHNPPEAKVIRIFMETMPHVTNVAVFDTAFHQTMPKENYLYSIPMEYYDKYQARRYGAHGTSHMYVSERVCEVMNRPKEDCKVITCHLGNGASITAVDGGKSVDTSMGFTPLAGLTMGTRSGDIDPSLIAYLMEKENISDIQTFIDILNNQSGLLGLSGLSSDMRDLRDAAAEGNERAALAINIFRNRIVKYIGSYMATLNGCDALVFTGGIGENDIDAREAICEQLTWLGVEIDKEANHIRGEEREISTKDSKVRVFVIPTEEELMIARDVYRLS